MYKTTVFEGQHQKRLYIKYLMNAESVVTTTVSHNQNQKLCYGLGLRLSGRARA